MSAEGWPVSQQETAHLHSTFDIESRLYHLQFELPLGTFGHPSHKHVKWGRMFSREGKNECSIRLCEGASERLGGRLAHGNLAFCVDMGVGCSCYRASPELKGLVETENVSSKPWKMQFQAKPGHQVNVSSSRTPGGSQKPLDIPGVRGLSLYNQGVCLHR